MADICDLAQHQIDQELERNLRAVKNVPLPAGTPGDCDLCGEWAGRLILGACAPCRDRHRLN